MQRAPHSCDRFRRSSASEAGVVAATCAWEYACTQDSWGASMPKPKVTGATIGPIGVSWEYVQSIRELARRVIVFLEPRRVLTDDHRREDFDDCRASAHQIRDFLTIEIMN